MWMEQRFLSRYPSKCWTLKIAARIDYKMFSDSLDFSVEHNHVHIIKKSLEIDFGKNLDS